MTRSSALLLVAFLVAVVSLGNARFRIGSVRAWVFAPSSRRGRAGAGVRYAFTTAFLPWAKESASGHIVWYTAGLLYHAGAFALLAGLVLSLAALVPPWPLAWALAGLFGAALVSGLALLARRRLDPALRALSVPDDYVANLLVDATLAAGLVAALRPAAVPLFQLAGAALLCYAPLGKIRHMVFLFTARRLWGVFYGRRGVLP